MSNERLGMEGYTLNPQAHVKKKYRKVRKKPFQTENHFLEISV